jgi:hypothetical protein
MDIDHDLQFQQRDWKAERVAWVLMALVVIAALTGLFGAGPVSEAKEGDEAGALQLEYERFGRVSREMPLRVRFRPPRPDAGEAAVSLDAAYLRDVSVERVDPSPVRTEVDSDRVSFVFAVKGTEPVHAVFHLKADRPGRHKGSVGTPEGDRLPISHLIYP